MQAEFRIIPHIWKEHLTYIQDNAEIRSIYVLGGVDRGKTTFAGYLFRHLSISHTIAYIDTDPGQSVVGPPGTLGMDDGNTTTILLRFLGSLTPVNDMERMIKNVQYLCKKASSFGYDTYIIDSCGLAEGKIGNLFQSRVLESIKPDLVFCLHHQNELKELRQKIQSFAQSQVFSVPPPSHVKRKTYKMRKTYRRSLFTSYFKNATYTSIPLSELHIHTYEDETTIETLDTIENEGTWEKILHRYSALCDVSLDVISLGIVVDYKKTSSNESDCLIFWSPRKTVTPKREKSYPKWLLISSMKMKPTDIFPRETVHDE